MPGAIIAIGILKLSSSLDSLISLVLIGSTLGLIFAYLVRFCCCLATYRIKYGETVR